MALHKLSNDQLVFLAFHYTSESDLSALRSVLSSRRDAFTTELILRVLLTFLPESTDPAAYVDLVEDVASGRYAEPADAPSLDISPVEELLRSKAYARIKHQHLLSLEHTSCPSSENVCTRFLIHRAHRLDEAGLLPLIPPLVDPFLGTSDFLRTWFISNVLPLLRFQYEYYPGQLSTFSLDRCETAKMEEALDTWLSHKHEGTQPSAKRAVAGQDDWSDQGNIMARDMRGLVGPWMYGYQQRKRRRLQDRPRRPSSIPQDTQESSATMLNNQEQQQGWAQAFLWLIRTAEDRLPIVAETFNAWDGPSDVDFGGFHEGPYLQDSVQRYLTLGYIQAAFASVYAANSDSTETISNAYTIVGRISRLGELGTLPASLGAGKVLPKVEGEISDVAVLPTSMLETASLLAPEHPLTTPNPETFNLLQLFVYSADIIAQLDHRMSIANVVRLRMQSDAEEQLSVLKKLLHSLSTGPKRDEQQWNSTRQRLLWLWNWNFAPSENENRCASGVFGKLSRMAVEEEFLKLLLSAACYPFILKIYVKGSDTGLSRKQIEDIVVLSVLHQYDNASNGNRSRGGMKKAFDIISNLKPYFPQSTPLEEIEALLTATHSLSFYSLTLQHGVPFQPVNIRVSKDPVGLIEKVLAQNPRSYTQLDDLITIGVNLLTASPLSHRLEDDATPRLTNEKLNTERRKTERRVIGMAIEAALSEDDFETAYSYVVNRLDTSGASTTANADAISAQDDDDISWRAALAAGRHRSNAVSMSASASLSTPPALRRLEQRMELLSQALLLAPPSALPEILSAWRKCEEEMTALLAQEKAAEDAFNDRADQRLPGTFVNATAPIQPRREVGRGVNEEAPMGLFDLARGAAGAFSRSAFPTRHAATKTAPLPAQPGSPTIASNDMTSSGELEYPGRARKRDMIADAATGALASGLGWVLGAKPTQQEHK